MTQFHPTLLRNWMTYHGQQAVPNDDPPPKTLRGSLNRTFNCDWPVLERYRCHIPGWQRAEVLPWK